MVIDAGMLESVNRSAPMHASATSPRKDNPSQLREHTKATRELLLPWQHLNQNIANMATPEDNAFPTGTVITTIVVGLLMAASLASGSAMGWTRAGSLEKPLRPRPTTTSLAVPAPSPSPTPAPARDQPVQLIPLSHRVSLSSGNRAAAERANAAGYLLYKRGPGNDRQARVKYLQAVKLDPSYDLAWYNLACTEALLGDIDGAMGALRNVGQLKPANLLLRIRQDSDFMGLRANASFRQWIDHEGWRGNPSDLVDATHVVASVSGSSQKPEWQGYTFASSNLLDLDTTTSWQPDSNGGVGAWFKLDLSEETNVGGVEVANGLQLKDRLGDLFAGNNRVNAARITFDDGTFVEVSFPDPQRGWTRFEWIPKRTRTLTFTVNSVHRGTRWNDLAISEVRILRVK